MRPSTGGDPNMTGALGSVGRERSTSGLRDTSVDLPSASQHLGSGVGAGNVNAALSSKYRMDYQLLQDLQNKLREDTTENAMNVQQRQRIFEDIIIQRVKVIQNYVKKQVQKLKTEISHSGGSSNPVILNSIHNDGMALDLKIKDIVKWKVEAYEQKSKAKDDKLLQLEL